MDLRRPEYIDVCPAAMLQRFCTRLLLALPDIHAAMSEDFKTSKQGPKLVAHCTETKSHGTHFMHNHHKLMNKTNNLGHAQFLGTPSGVVLTRRT